MEYAVETKGLTKRYKDLTAVDHIDLRIEKGGLFALLGVNGAGKTTTIKMLSTLSYPDEGDALVGGKSIISDSAYVKGKIGVSPQETAVAPSLTARENLIFMCRIHGMNKEEAKAKTKEIASLLGLEPVMERRAGKLSGGWQRRLSIAMALVSDPEILFLDEPTLGLDVIARSELWALIRKLKTTSTIILTTHYMEEAESLSDKLAVMKSGRILFTGTGEEMKREAGCEKFEDAFVKLVTEERR